MNEALYETLGLCDLEIESCAGDPVKLARVRAAWKAHADAACYAPRFEDLPDKYPIGALPRIAWYWSIPAWLLACAGIWALLASCRRFIPS